VSGYMTPAVNWKHVYDAMRTVEDDQIKRIKLPLLLHLWGENDAVVPASWSEQQAKDFRSHFLTEDEIKTEGFLNSSSPLLSNSWGFAFRHPGGHFIPVTPLTKSLFRPFFSPFLSPPRSQS